MSQLASTQGPKSFGTAPRKSYFDGGDKSIPGPGAHSPERIDKIQNPQWALGTSKDRNSFTEPFRAQYPSPQLYHPHYQLIEKNPPKYSIPNANSKHRPAEIFSTIYKPSLQAVVKQEPSFSFGYTIDNNYETSVPGVGSYELVEKKFVLNRTQNHFGKGERPLPYGEEGRFPGPGNYHSVDLKSTAQFSFPKAKRSVPQVKEPPAKFYDIGPKKKVPRSTRIYDIKQKKRETLLFQHNQNPAPNQYNTLIPYKIPSGIIEYSKRLPLENVSMSKNPSPQKYTGQESIPKTKKGYTFGKDIRSFSVPENVVPPPGIYEPMKTLSTIGGAMTKYQSKDTDTSAPAPTDYRPKYHLTTGKARSPIIFRGQRVDFSKTLTGPIGPGQYKFQSNHSPHELGKIGKSQRVSLYESSNNPGVGDYNIPSFIGRLPKYYTSPKKITENGYSTFHEKLRIKMQQRQRIKNLEKGDIELKKSSSQNQHEQIHK